MKEKRWNIGLFTPSTGDSVRGIFLLNFVNLLSSFAKNIYVIASNVAPKHYSGAYFYPVEHKGGTNAFRKIMNHLIFQVRVSYKLARLAKNVDFWIFFLGGESFLLPMLTAKLFNKKVVLVLGGYLEKEVECQRNIFLCKPPILSKKINCDLADKLVLYSERLIYYWNLEKYRNKLLIAQRHFIDFNKFKTEKQLNERTNLVGYIGSLTELKGILNILKAIPELVGGKEIRFLIGGDGPLQAQVEEYLNRENLNDKVNFVGWIPHDELPKYLNELKLLVLPSYSEGLPNILLEAMTCGTPVLATPVGAIPDIITDGVTGLILEDNSSACIAENVIRALEHPDLERIVKNARVLVEREFTYEAAVERYRKILEGI